jgi:phosphatidylserine decarboxylase
MDPFVIVSLGKKTFRTKHIRHSLNPVYDEKMLFQVLRHEQNYSLSFTVVDRDKFSSNDFVAQASFPVSEIQRTQPVADPETGLYYFSDIENAQGAPGTPPATDYSTTGSRSRFRLPLPRSTSAVALAPNKRPDLPHQTSLKSLGSLTADGAGVPLEDPIIIPPSPNKAIPAQNIGYELKSYDVPLTLKNKDRWETKHKPELHINVKYVPYPGLRQQFWRHLLRQYDSDDSGNISRVELATMLDTLGSTLHETTINSFFQRFKGTSSDPESLEAAELSFDQVLICLEDQLTALSQKTPTSSSMGSIPRVAINHSSDDSKSSRSGDLDSEAPTPMNGSRNQSSISLQQQPVLGTPGEEGTLVDNDLGIDSRSEEHVIQIRECPLCHQPRMNKRSEMDIVTHLATCASQDWRQVDKLVMGGFVTSSQAQRKWYSKVRRTGRHMHSVAYEVAGHLKNIVRRL